MVDIQMAVLAGQHGTICFEDKVLTPRFTCGERRGFAFRVTVTAPLLVVAFALLAAAPILAAEATVAAGHQTGLPEIWEDHGHA